MTEHWGREIHFPDITTFDELFPCVGERNKQELENVLRRFEFESGSFLGNGKRKMVHQVVGSGLSISGNKEPYRYTHIVEINPALLDCIEEYMIRVDYDSISFQINVWDDGRALVCAHYSQILGSRYLAVIDASTIPDHLKAVVPEPA
jgi:hypothetical protein